jgi:hypothetical protein
MMLSKVELKLLREEISTIIQDWHTGCEDMFDNEDLEDMTSDIIKVVNEKLSSRTIKKTNLILDK